MIFFVHLPRTAGTFISEYAKHKSTRLRKQFNYWPPGHGKEIKRHIPASTIPDYKNHYLFGLVRNPYDWYVSQYFYMVGKKKPIIEDGIFKGVDKGLWGEGFVKEFPTFADWMKYGIESNLEHFWLSNLYYYFYFYNDVNIMNHIGKFENLNDEFNFVLKENDIKPRVQLKDFWGNKNESKHEGYKKYYTDFLSDYVFLKDQDIFTEYEYLQ